MQRKVGEIDPTSVITPKDPGDIPTFDEWKKQVMEVEKEKSELTYSFWIHLEQIFSPLYI